MSPNRAPTTGMMMSPVSEVTIVPNAAPTITATARSSTLPRERNSRKPDMDCSPAAPSSHGTTGGEYRVRRWKVQRVQSGARLGPEVAGRHQRRHPQPVRADVESEAQPRPSGLAPAVAGEQPGREQPVGQAVAPGDRALDRGAVEARRQPQGARDRGAELMQAGA